MEVYVRRGEEQFGPFTRGQIEESLANGALIDGDIAWHKGLEDWVPVQQVLGTLTTAAAPPEPTPAATGGGKKILLALAATVVIGGVAGALVLPDMLSGEDSPPSAAPVDGVSAQAEPEASAAPEPVAPVGGFEVVTNEPVAVVEIPTQVEPTPATLLPPQPVNVLPPAPLAVGPEDTAFTSVTRHLDKGGALYSYLRTQKAQEWMQTIFADGEALARELGLAHEASPIDFKAGLGLARDAYAVLGLDQIDSLGASTRKLPSGLKRNVAVIHREKEKGAGVVWSAFGKKPHELAALSLMPADTALAVQGDLDLVALLGAFETIVGKHGTEGFRVELANDFKNATVRTLLNSYGGELGFYLTLDAENTIEVPAGVGLTDLFQPGPAPETTQTADKPGELPALPLAKPAEVATVKIPEPGLVIVVRVRDDGVEKLLNATLAAQGLPLQMAQVGAVPIWHLAQPIPLKNGLALQPAMARVDDYLIITSNPKLASRVIAVQQGSSPALAATGEFKKLAAGMTLKGNQFGFLSERLVKVHEALSQAKPGAPEADALTVLWRKLAGQGLTAQVSVMRAEPRELVMETHTHGMGYDTAVLLAGAGVPVMMGLALAAPALLENGDLAADEQFNAEMKLSQGRLLGAGLMRVSLKNGAWPKAETWSDQLLELIGDQKHFVEPVMVNPLKPDEKICTWLFNKNLSGKKSGEVPDPRNTVLLFAAESIEWNGAGDEHDFPVDAGKVVTVFADGHLEEVGPGDAARLKWKP